jgi:hypothetical protein
MEVQHPDKSPEFLGGVIQSIKDRLNAMTEEQSKAQEVLEGWRTVIGEMTEAEHFNEKLSAVKQAPKAAQALFAAAATEKGYTFDKKAGKYLAPATAEAAE